MKRKGVMNDGDLGFLRLLLPSMAPLALVIIEVE